ncbi:GNAT family N-acetyltransferase [Streptomyces diastatochromogenes]|uniref:GNAT family N-acetyltransferase n=1 Tax=Streptomyces diastatochromogenes TaxID=42236 RepID=UPI002F2675C2
MSHHARIRQITDDDWGGIAALESRAYAALGLSEEPAALRSRGHASPDTCFVLDLPHGLAGYLLALPYPMFHYPDLVRAEGVAAGHAEGPAAGTVVPSRNLHLHDLVIAEPLRGRGLAGRLLRHLTATARAGGYEQLSLVAVAGSGTFWAAHGFVRHPGVVPPGEYGGQAVYMSRPVRGDRTAAPKPAGATSHGPAPHHHEGE